MRRPTGGLNRIRGVYSEAFRSPEALFIYVQQVNQKHRLSDDKLVAVMRAVLKLPTEQRNVVLRHIAGRLPIYGSGCFGRGFDKAIHVVIRELILRMALQDLAQHVDALLRRPLGSSSAIQHARPIARRIG